MHDYAVLKIAFLIPNLFPSKNSTFWQEWRAQQIFGGTNIKIDDSAPHPTGPREQGHLLGSPQYEATFTISSTFPRNCSIGTGIPELSRTAKSYTVRQDGASFCRKGGGWQGLAGRCGGGLDHPTRQVGDQPSPTNQPYGIRKKEFLQQKNMV